MFYLRLALALGRTPQELGATLTAREFAEYLALQRIAPLPDHYWIGGQVAAVVANCMGGGGKRWSVDDFVPTPRQPPKRLTPEETVAYMRAHILPGAKGK